MSKSFSVNNLLRPAPKNVLTGFETFPWMAILNGNLCLSHSDVVANGANKQFNNQQARDLDSEFLEDHPRKRTTKEKGFELLEKYIKQSIAVSTFSKVEGSEIPRKQIKALKKISD